MYPFPSPSVWTCRVYPFPPPAVGRACYVSLSITSSMEVQGVSLFITCSMDVRVYPFPSPAVGRAWCVSFSNTSSGRACYVSLSITISMDVQGVSLSTTSSWEGMLCIPFHHQQCRCAMCISIFLPQLTMWTGCILLLHLQCGLEGCIPFHCPSVWTCRVRCPSLSPSALHVDVQGVPWNKKGNTPLSAV